MATLQLEDLRKDQDIITSGSTWKAIWMMSWPLLLNMGTLAAANFVDIWVAGHLGADAQAAVGLGGQIWYFIMMLTLALAAGTTALVSRFWGARDLEGAVEAARQSLVFALLFGVSSAIVGLLSCRYIVRMLGASPSVEQQAWNYLSFSVLSNIPYTLTWISNSIFRARGDARTPMVTMTLCSVVVIALDMVLCMYPFQIGVGGLGISWIIAGSIGVIMNFNWLKRSELRGCLDFRAILARGISLDWLARLMNIGIPACIQDLALIGGSIGLFAILARTADPTSAQAAWAVGWRLEEVATIMPMYALNMAIATIVGQNLGAGKSERAQRASWQVAFLGASINLALGLIMFFGASNISRYMSTDLHVINMVTTYLQVVGLTEPFIAIWLILSGAMQGAGYTRWPMIATVACLAVLRLSLAWPLTVSVGQTGTWIAMGLSTVVAGLVLMWMFRKGNWKRQQV